MYSHPSATTLLALELRKRCIAIGYIKQSKYEKSHLKLRNHRTKMTL